MQTKISFPELNPFKFKGSRERTNNAGHHTPDVLGDLEEVRDGGGIKQLVLEEEREKKEEKRNQDLAKKENPQGKGEALTGTFFWMTTTAESAPRTPMEVRPLELIALNAYSKINNNHNKKSIEYSQKIIK